MVRMREFPAKSHPRVVPPTCSPRVAMAADEELNVDSLCQEYVSGLSVLEAPKILAKGIQSGKINLLKVVEALGCYLTSTVVENRSQGTRLLSEVLAQLHSHTLLPDEVHYLALFYCDRLKDKAVIVPHVLCGLHALASYQHLESEDVVNICRTVFREVHNQSLQQSERRTVYTIMNIFLGSYLEAVRGLGSDFVLGYIQAMDGEKDPRNLVIVFNTVPTIIQHLPFDVLAEDLFEVTSCYFPIDFTPPPNDPHTITREELVLGLRKCLTVTPKFAEFCLPLLLEKLSSDIQSAKVDSLLTLAAGAETYGAEGLGVFMEAIWFALKKEIFQSVSDEVEDAGLCALTAVARALSSPLQPSPRARGQLQILLDMVTKDCRRHLCEPELRLMRPAARMLQAVARASDPACASITATIIPLLMEQYTLQRQTGHRRTILEVLLEFIRVLKTFTSDKEVPSPLLPHKDTLTALLLSALADSHASIRVITIATIAGLLDLDNFLEPKELCLSTGHLKGLALTDMDGTVRRESSLALGFLAKLHPDVVREEVFPSLLQRLTCDPPMDADPPPPAASRCVQLLAALSTHLSLLSTTLPTLTQYLSYLSRFQPCSEDHRLQARAASSSMLAIVEGNISHDSCVSLLRDSTVADILSLCIKPTVSHPPPQAHVLTDEAVLSDFAALLRCYTQVLDISQSQVLLELLMDIFTKGSLGGVQLPDTEELFAPLEPSSPHHQTQLVVLLTGSVGSMRSEVISPFSSSLLPPLLHLSTHCPHHTSSIHATKCYASVINKLPQGDELSHMLDKDKQLLWQLLLDDSERIDAGQKCRALAVWIWVTKALVMRSHTCGRDAAIKLLSLLGDPVLSTEVTEGFQLILSDQTDVLNRQCHATVRLMYKQQFFVEVVPEIMRQFHQGDPARRQYLLRALSQVMQGVPKQVLLGELPSLLPLLLESLQCNEAGLRVSTLEGLFSLLHDAPQVVSEHVPTLVPRLLELARAPESMKVRTGALRCMGTLTTLPLHTVYPYKDTVIRGLALCLDDKKRLVRKEAVKSRSDWFLLGAV